MLQDVGPGRFDNQIRFHAPGPETVALLYRGSAVRAKLREGQLTLPRFGALPADKKSLSFHYGFALGDTEYFLAEDPDLDPADAVQSREYRYAAPREAAFACAVGESLARWYGATRFCGRCGAALGDSEIERARVCPACGLIVYPKICPAVIVAVCDGDRLLLTHYKNRPFRKHALVAGFNEIGESIEDTVRREVREETGLRVKNLRFYKSQPWVLTDSLLLGFFCDLDGSDEVTVQADELADARWVPRSALDRVDYSPISLTGEMIERFHSGKT